MLAGTILLVEDEPNDVDLCLRALRTNQITNNVVVARDGQEALDKLFHAAAEPGVNTLPVVVLLDLKLPKISGLEVLRRIRAHPRTHLVPVVLLTGSDQEEDRLRGYESGANSYVRKPVDFLEFSEAVKQIGLYWLVVNRPAPERG